MLFSHNQRVIYALFGGLVAAAATALGILPIFFTRQLKDCATDCMMGFRVGVMLASSIFSFILLGLSAAEENGSGPWLAGGVSA